MKALFRVDASLEMGTGHVMRCLTLARALAEKSVKIEFLCRDHSGSLINKIRSLNFFVHVFPTSNSRPDLSQQEALFHAKWLGVTQQKDIEDCKSIIKEANPDWLIVDHYAIDRTWESVFKPYCRKLVVIDDLGDRKHICDFLIDQNYGSDIGKYQKLVPKSCTILTGPKYALLRPEFFQWREYSLKRRLGNDQIKRILITMGGVDLDNYTGQILEKLSEIKWSHGVELTVVMNIEAPHLDSVINQVENMTIETVIKTDVNNMAELMSNADLAIGATGATTWERCCLGLPTIQLVIADNQKLAAQALGKDGVVMLIDDVKNLKDIMSSIYPKLNQLKDRSRQLTEGDGVNLVLRVLGL